ncbi:F0F1 ATP synthase subunit delta [Parabacteroides chinchillae]|uniref:ATP synthase subunit delta n=1 Tax=Parabacteroides chinchillae TaxID=871327 RepID=A0A8G2BWV6_9BACT|nr:F0F1 ATP synthase subunit delta [Parabacteroides chinchillae]SEF94776.1 ATP synthase F1 subcomplex delta subunit [Parabacteroides chinchillae]
MDIGRISPRYASALFSLAKEKGEEVRVYQDMKMLADSFSLEPALKEAIANPVVTATEKEQLLIAAGGIEVCDLYKRFIRLVLQHRRENQLLFITYIYIHLYRKDKKIARVYFSTAVPVGDEVKHHLVDKLERETKNKIEFVGYVKPELLGGFCLQIGNCRIDASYATGLNDIRSRLFENR